MSWSCLHEEGKKDEGDWCCAGSVVKRKTSKAVALSVQASTMATSSA